MRRLFLIFLLVFIADAPQRAFTQVFSAIQPTGGNGTITTGFTVVTASIASATSGSVTPSPSTFAQTLVTWTGTLGAQTQNTMILNFNSDTSGPDYAITRSVEGDSSGGTIATLGFGTGIPLTFTGGAGSGAAASAAISYTLLLTFAAGTTTWDVVGTYASGSFGTAVVGAHGTFNAAVTSVGISSGNAFSATLNSTKVS